MNGALGVSISYDMCMSHDMCHNMPLRLKHGVFSHYNIGHWFCKVFAGLSKRSNTLVVYLCIKSIQSYSK